LPVGSGEPDDAETGAEALFRMRALVEDQIAQRRGGRPDRGGILADLRVPLPSVLPWSVVSVVGAATVLS